MRFLLLHRLESFVHQCKAGMMCMQCYCRSRRFMLKIPSNLDLDVSHFARLFLRTSALNLEHRQSKYFVPTLAKSLCESTVRLRSTAISRRYFVVLFEIYNSSQGFLRSDRPAEARTDRSGALAPARRTILHGWTNEGSKRTPTLSLVSNKARRPRRDPHGSRMLLSSVRSHFAAQCVNQWPGGVSCSRAQHHQSSSGIPMDWVSKPNEWHIFNAANGGWRGL